MLKNPKKMVPVTETRCKGCYHLKKVDLNDWKGDIIHACRAHRHTHFYKDELVPEDWAVDCREFKPIPGL